METKETKKKKEICPVCGKETDFLFKCLNNDWLCLSCVHDVRKYIQDKKNNKKAS